MTSGYITCVCKSGTGWVQSSDGVTACNWTAAGVTTISNTAVVGSTCAGNVTGGIPTVPDIALNGRVAQSSTGVILSCASGTWLAQSNVDSGTLCGVHSVAAGGQGNYSTLGVNPTLCKGIDPMNGCPNGYTQAQIYISSSGGVGALFSGFYTCTHN